MFCFNTDQEFDYESMGQFKDSLGNLPQKFCPCCLMMLYNEKFKDTHGHTSTATIKAEHLALKH